MKHKKTIFFSIFMLFFSTILAQKISVLIDYKSYYANEPYLEISTFINGKSVIYLPDNEGKYHAEVRITVQALQNENLVNVLDYIIQSETFNDPVAETKPNFGDIQNMPLPNGEYLLKFTVQDVNSENKPVHYAEIALIDFPQDKVSISDISLYKNMSRDTKGDLFDKYGFSLEPLFYGYVPADMYNLPFSCEIYDTDKLADNEQLTVKCFITCFENNLMPYQEARFITYPKTKSVIPIIGEIGIYKLPSGNYNLVVEVYGKDSDLLATNSFFFQRNNPSLQINIEEVDLLNIENTFVDQIKDTMQLLEYVRFLFPISTPVERNFYQVRMKLISTESLKKFFYAFWLKRDPINPEKAWMEYLEKVKYVNKVYGCKIVQGYRTDRGRVFLQYGPPESISESPFDSHSFPYEIWHYYYCVDQSNVKFVFYNRDLVSNDYELLHSDKRGEMQDPFWQIKLTQRDVPNFDFDVRSPESYYGGNPKDDWKYHR